MNEEINRLTEQIIGAAIEFGDLGPGLLESAYQKALAHELRLRQQAFEEQKLALQDLLIEDAYRLDFLVGPKVVTNSRPDALLDVHEAQVLTYLRFSTCWPAFQFPHHAAYQTRPAPPLRHDLRSRHRP